MKVIVYFRQSGGIPAGDIPMTVQLAKDADEILTPVLSTFDTNKMPASHSEILTQADAANAWLATNRGVVVATFTEIENGSGQRPAFIAARKAAIRNRAVILVATSQAIEGQEFLPASQDGVEVVTLPISPIMDLLRKTASGRTPVVVYLRAGPKGPDADILLHKQRHAIKASNISDNILAEFLEFESTVPTTRPQLAKALELCRERKALLFIGTTDAIGDEGAFEPEFTDVPYEVAYRQAYEWPALIPISGCPFPVALHFGTQWVNGNIPLYLANCTGTDFLTVDVNSRGSTTIEDDLLETTIGAKRLGPVPTSHAALVEAYDVYFDGDFLVEYRVEAILADGTTFLGRALVKDVPTSRWLPVELSQPIRS